MFLKRLETIGFKSFAERITIEFVPGITTIVGPNGSGKSNVIDAIRWVLGEQSARSLRGQRMEDVIFQGSETRNPLNFAEVSLILNNESGELPIEYQEVKVTRRVYRSGESEFLINKQPCRLKDIVDLFTDTGLGRESFSIIGQGKIDEILSSKADERRAVFEEAAGVMRYKRRKEEAAYKLKETEDNLARVEDIIYEISQQIEPLKKQAKIAKEYKTLQAKLTEKEIALLVTEISTLHEKWQQLLQKIERDTLKLVERETTLQQFEAKIITRREEVEQLETTIQSLHERLIEVTEQLEQTEGKRNVRIEQTKHHEENKQKIKKEKKDLQIALQTLETRIEEEEKQVNAIHKHLQSIHEEMKRVEANLYSRHDELGDEIDRLKGDLIEYLNEQAVLNNEHNALTERLRQLKVRLTSEDNRKESMQSQYQQLKKERKSLLKQKEEKEAQLTSYKQAINDLEKTIIDEVAQLEEKQRQFYALQEQRTRSNSRKEMLEEMKKNYQGFAYGVKEILQATKRGDLQGIIGPVIDLIEVPNRYIIAVDTILGHQSQFIVVPDDATARATIAWLKRENKGRATFLPLQSIVARFLPSQVRSLLEEEQGFIGIASELVRIEPHYQKVIEHLMGNVIVAETLADANRIASRTNRRYRIVTLEGDVVFPGGSISGGAQRKRNVSLFTREKELNELTERVRQIDQQLTNLQKEQKIRNEKLEQIQEKEKAQKEALQALQNEYDVIIGKVQQYEIKEQSLKDRLTTYEHQHNEYEAERASLKEKIEQNQKQLKDAKGKIARTQETIQMKTEEQAKLLENKAKNEKLLHELQLKNAEQQERAKHFEKIVQSLESERKSTLEKLEDIDEQLVAIEKLEAEQESLETIEKKLTTYRKERQAVSTKITELQAKRKEKMQEIEDDSRELEARRKLFEEMKKTLQDKEIEASRLDVKLENRLQTLQETYTITYEKAYETYGKVEDVAKRTDEVQELRRKIRALGTVNLGAIEEYERLKERETFLDEQRNDLLEAKETLYEAIQKMDDEMITRFKATFETIQHAFTDVFSQLFGGGYAELVLTDPDNYLETGIDIIARPPGKKLKTLELLSGGERALTAIALLFAILRARPVPFVILDEVDAALDEANVDRFATYLKNFSKESQFVVISHRKGTMEEADALYGVTMQESGVSRFVSVRLEEADDLVKST